MCPKSAPPLLFHLFANDITIPLIAQNSNLGNCIILYPSATLDILDYGILEVSPTLLLPWWHILRFQSSLLHWPLLISSSSFLSWYIKDKCRHPDPLLYFCPLGSFGPLAWSILCMLMTPGFIPLGHSFLLCSILMKPSANLTSTDDACWEFQTIWPNRTLNLVYHWFLP